MHEENLQRCRWLDCCMLEWTILVVITVITAVMDAAIIIFIPTESNLCTSLSVDRNVLL